jgi:radical SAM protein with 4Fe4S-binding SPASM domain
MTVSARPRLQSLLFEVTQRCNHACLHCYNIWHGDDYGTSNEQEGEPLLPLIERALDQADCQHVTLTGGEPLLCPELPAILDRLQERGVGSTIITNGRLLTAEMVADLLERGTGLFEVPLLSYRREVHDRLSGSPGAFDAALAAMSYIRYQRGQFVPVFVATRLNLPDLEGAIKLAVAFGARALMLNRFNPGGRGRSHLDLLPTAAELRGALAVADAAAARYDLSIACSIPIQPCLIDLTAYPHLHSGFCAAGTERAYYTFDRSGNVRPCNHTPTILGNLWQTPLAELIAGKTIADFAQAVPPVCEPCAHRLECQGGCKAAAQVCYGSLTEEEPFLRRNRLADVRA